MKNIDMFHSLPISSTSCYFLFEKFLSCISERRNDVSIFLLIMILYFELSDVKAVADLCQLLC